MSRHALAALLLFAAAPAAAQDRPQMFPTRDVSVTYRFTGTEAAAMPGMTISWLAATQAMRNDIPGVGWMVADHRAGRAFMVMEAMRMIMDIPLDQAASQAATLSSRATFRREGGQSVAGQSCTVWSYTEGQRSGRACITADGVMLRAESTVQGKPVTMEATQVAYGAQDPARFQRPQGYQAMPQMPGGGQMPGMPGGPGMPGAPQRQTR
jgi:hypothetical protein